MKRLVRDNYRVVISIDPTWRRGYGSDDDYKDTQRDAEHARDQVVRHVDVAQHNVRVEWDTETICGFCHWEWEKSFDGPEGPGCCDRAMEEWERQQREKGV